MKQFDVIVIGGGVNGLVAATLLGKKGKSVCVVEQSAHFGGMASFSVDGGPCLAHSLYNLSSRVLQDIGLTAEADALRGTPVATVSLSDDGRHVVFDGARVSWIDGTEHEDSAIWGDLTGQLLRYGDLLRQLAEAAPPGGAQFLLSRDGLAQFARLAKVGIGLKRLGKSEMRRFLQVLLSNVYDFLLDDLSDGPVAGLLAADAVRGAATGPRSPGTVFNLIYRLGHGGTVTRPKSGMRAVTDRLVNVARQARCTLMADTGVARILLAEDMAAGIELANGETLGAAVVLSSIAPQPTARLAGHSYYDIETSRRIRNVRARGTTAKVNFKLKDEGTLPGLPASYADARLVYAPSAEYVEAAFNPAKYRAMSKAPVIEAMRTQTADGAHWLSCIVQYAPSDLEGGWSEDAKEALADLTLGTLSRALPGLEGNVDGHQVITPDLIEAATGAPGGHWHHAEMALDQLLSLRPVNGLGHYAMGPKGLFLCGAATHPGGDVMGLAGRNAALAVLGDKS